MSVAPSYCYKINLLVFLLHAFIKLVIPFILEALDQKMMTETVPKTSILYWKKCRVDHD
jgi:hypothetical protein